MSTQNESAPEARRAEEIKAAVRERYAAVARGGGNCCGPGACGCSAEALARQSGYAAPDFATAPEGSNLGLGCGNPVALASLRPGETVLDLGSGAGFDAFLAADRVGFTGRVIGVDMTPDMVARAGSLAERHGFTNVAFRLGDIEALPVESSSIDAVISNCVVNLAPDKARVFREAFRVLKGGGRLMVSDLVLLAPLPEDLVGDLDATAACLAGALPKAEYLAAIAEAGFAGIEIQGEHRYDAGRPDLRVASLQIRALKPL